MRGSARYRDFVRREGRFRPDQVQALAALRRRLQQERVDRTEAITDNTLVRVAVDLLLRHADRLHGDNERELADSVLGEP